MSLSGLDLCPRRDALLGRRRPAADRRLDQGGAVWRAGGEPFRRTPTPVLPGAYAERGALPSASAGPCTPADSRFPKGMRAPISLSFAALILVCPHMNAPVAPHSLLETAGVEPGRAGAILA